ncbi:MAG: alginate lyase family protein [Bacteroides sp.]|nr:alginate lyase family protein [Bacteroides sp.]
MNKMETFFTLLDLERDGLEGVKELSGQKKFPEAAMALLEYFRKREGISYYDGWDKRPLGEEFDTTKADAICNNHIVHQDLPEDIDWQADPHGDPEWKYCLHRHEYLTELGRAYWYTGDEKYTRHWMRLLGDWIEKNPMPDLDWMTTVDGETSRMYFMKQGNWRPIELGIRMYTAFVPCFYHFLDSPEFTPDFLLTMLGSMYEHALHSRWYYTRHKSYFNVSPNWGLMESNGLAHMGILFPEFREAADWKGEAMSRFEEQIRTQVLPDGMQEERAAGYHLVCTFCFLQILDLALKNGIKVSDTLLKGIESMVDFVAGIMKPHGYFPMLKDGDEGDVFGERASYGLWEDINNLNMLEDYNDLRWVLKAGSRIFKRPDFLYIATHGREGEIPEYLSVAAPDAGFYTMRSGWQNDDLYMVFTCGELGAMDQNCVHGNADALSVDVSGFGETLLIDPGRYMYEGPYRIWFKQTQAHNTIVVDGQDSSELADGWMFKNRAKSVVRTWSSAEAFDFVDGSHDGYHRLKDPVTHRRRIIFIKPKIWLIVDDLEASENHQYDQYFHFGAEARLEVSGLNVTAKYGSQAGISLIPSSGSGLSLDRFKGSTDPIQGWVSYDYGVKEAAEVVKYSINAGSVQLATLLLPFGTDAGECRLKTIEKDVFELSFSEQKYLVILSDEARKKWNDFEFDGVMLFARFDSDGVLKECSGALTSSIIFRGKTILDASVPGKEDISITL